MRKWITTLALFACACTPATQFEVDGKRVVVDDDSYLGRDPSPTPSPSVSPSPSPSPSPTASPSPSPSPTPTPNPNWSARNSARIMFSGHSLLNSPITDYVQDVATKKGDTNSWNMQIVGGSPLRVRTKGNNTGASNWPGYNGGTNRSGSGLNIINEFLNPQTIGAGNRYDSLVVTERHDLLSVIRWEDTFAYLRHFHDRFIAGNASGQTYFYHSWLDIDKSNPSVWIAYEKAARGVWECAVVKVNSSLQTDGRTERVRNVPAGAALVDLVERALNDEVPGITGTTAGKLNAIFSDNVHLTDLGSYYAALVTYSAVYGKTGHGVSPPSSVNATTAATLQQIAWSYVNNYYNQPNVGVHTMAQCRTMAANIVTNYNIIDGDNQSASYWGHATDSPFRDAAFTKFPAP